MQKPYVLRGVAPNDGKPQQAGLLMAAFVHWGKLSYQFSSVESTNQD